MNRDFVVRIRLSAPGQASGVAGTIKERFGPIESTLRDRHLILKFAAQEEPDQMLSALQNCLDQAAMKGDDSGTPEIVETGFAAPVGKVELPRDIRLDPAFSFGSGSHPSTRLAMDLLEEYAGEQSPERVLDVGCGSGILALLAARLGADKVLGVEIDPESVTAAGKNVEANNLAATVTISEQPLAEVRGEFDLILANLTASVLYNLAAEINRLAAGKASLIVSGLQGRQVEEAALFLGKFGWLRRKQESDGKWQALLLGRDGGYLSLAPLTLGEGLGGIKA